SGGHQTAVPK
nr:Chain C, Crystal structure of thrombin-avathrin complex [Amblyomma variegatum]